MKLLNELQFRHVVGAAAALIVLLLTAQVGLAAGPNFNQQRVTLGAITFEDGATDYSIERVSNVRLEFEVDNGGDLALFLEKQTGRISFGDSTAPTDAPFHFRPTDDGSDAAILVDNSGVGGLPTPRNMFELQNNGAPRFVLTDSFLSRSFTFAMNPQGNFTMTRAGVAGAEIVIKNNGVIEMGPGTSTILRVTNAGVFATNYGQLSDREAKTDIEELSNKEILSKIKGVPVSSWRFKGEQNSSLHIGPMAQDFREAFGTGTSDRVINVGDLAGVALAGVRSLTEELEVSDAEVKELRNRLEEERSRSSELEERIGRLERLLKNNEM